MDLKQDIAMILEVAKDRQQEFVIRNGELMIKGPADLRTERFMEALNALKPDLRRHFGLDKEEVDVSSEQVSGTESGP